MSRTYGQKLGSGPAVLGGRGGWSNELSLARALESWPAATALYLAVAVLVTLPGLGSTGLVMMEGMVAYTAERMLEGGDLLVPELYGEIYTYKPPLVYWLAALSIKVFGRAEWAIRLPGAVATLLMGLAVLVLIGRVSKPRVGLFAALAATTGILWSQKVKLGEFDAVLASLIGVAIAAACHNLAAGRSRSSPRIWLLAYLALTAGCLAKGVPALMAFGPGLLGAAILSGQARQLWSRHHLAPAALFAALIGAYLALVWSFIGPAAFEQPLDEARQRGFMWTVESLGRTLTKPLVIVGAFLPWSLTWPWSFGGYPESSARQSPDGPSRRLRQTAWAFLLIGVVMFMAVPTHETRYYLPLAVPAAIVSALALERLAEPSRRASRVFQGLTLLSGVLLMALAFNPEFAGTVRLLLVAVGATAIAAAQLLQRHRPRFRIACLVLVSALCAWTAETWALRPYRARYRVLDSVARTLDRQLPQGATVWTLGAADPVGKNASLYYYLDRPVKTFHLADPLPPAGSYIVLTARKLRRLEETSPGDAARLELIQRVHHPWRLFLLYRVEAS